MKKITMLLLLLALFGCDKSATAQKEPMPATGGYRTGTVLDTIDVGNYTYIHLDEQGKEEWLASNPISVGKGDKVRFANAALMTNFHSEKLNRTFPEILFVNHIEVTGAGDTGGAQESPEAAPAQAAAATGENPHAKVHGAAGTPSEPVSVEPLKGGMTIAGIFAEKEKLEGKAVSLRAEVVKISPNIMGKNWMTLRDGTGTPPDDKLMMTTTWSASVGDVAVVTGTLKNNVDIGSGYTYKVLLEDARFAKGSQP